MDTSDLANRMKDYEKRNQYYLQKRTPIAIRVDGRSFHTFTKGFERPFDKVFMKSMQETAKYMCENIGNAKFAYVQSDEITIILVDYDTLETDCWFNYRTDKLCSISASMATMAFNKFFEKNINDWISKNTPSFHEVWYNPEDEKLYHVYLNASKKGAMFDARCFNIPKEEVTNLIYWRQLDAMRNSIQMVGQAHFSPAKLKNKTCNDIQDMLMTQCGINWNTFTIPCKRGTACIKAEEKETIKEPNIYLGEQIGERIIVRRKWKIDYEIPIFKGADRDYIDKLIFIEPTA